MSDTVEQIKTRLDIVDVISGYLKVQRAGANWKARCPFHNEKTPSFHISPERQSWHCFGCNKGGDMFSFVQEIEGIEFIESLRILATKAGVEMTERQGSSDGSNAGERRALLAATELSAKFFEKQLWHSNVGARALEYLRGRGLTDDTIRAWRLGWAPNDWRALTSFLSKEGSADRMIVASGMAVGRDGRPYDRFRSRIMFPIRDSNGQVVGFTGRVFGAEVVVPENGVPPQEGPAKYVNTPQTAIYDKGRILFGLDTAKLEMRKRGSALLVEGNMDAIASWQAGATNVVATSGTALTSNQLKMLSRHATTLDFCFDTDQAGQVATRRGIGLALAQNFTVRILGLNDPECKDPADYVAKYGEKWNEVVASAKPALQYYYDEAVAGYNPSSAESKKAVIVSVGSLVNRLTSHVERSHWVNQIAALLRTEPRAVEADLAAIKDDVSNERGPDEVKASTAPTPAPLEHLDAINENIVTLIAWRPSFAEQLRDHIALLDARVARLVQEPAILTGTEDSLVNSAFIRAGETWTEFTDVELKSELEGLIRKLRIRGLRRENEQMYAQIVAAETKKDESAVKVLLTAIDERNQQIKLLLYE